MHFVGFPEFCHQNSSQEHTVYTCSDGSKIQIEVWSPGSIHLEITKEWLCWFRHHLLDIFEACQMLEELHQEDNLFEQELTGESLVDQRSISNKRAPLGWLVHIVSRNDLWKYEHLALELVLYVRTSMTLQLTLKRHCRHQSGSWFSGLYIRWWCKRALYTRNEIILMCLMNSPYVLGNDNTLRTNISGTQWFILLPSTK